MRTSPDIAGKFALDVQSIDGLRTQAKHEPDKALRSAAQQFEALFMSMMMKSMRDAVPQGGMLDSNETRMYTSMLDQQLAQSMAKKGVGLADVMVRQLERSALLEGKQPSATSAVEQLLGAPTTSSPPTSVEQTPAVTAPAATEAPAPQSRGVLGSAFSSAKEFVNKLWPHAVQASRETGIPARFILGHAALESGWGKNEIRNADGTPSHNLFGIKAGRNWPGPVAKTHTTEYVDGVAQRSVEKFRSYGSYAQALRDYANTLLNNPRYAGVVDKGTSAASFAKGLQQAGYATDPAYADKLQRVINGTALRQGLIG
jgi:flagellar protein FlgJ